MRPPNHNLFLLASLIASASAFLTPHITGCRLNIRQKGIAMPICLGRSLGRFQRSCIGVSMSTSGIVPLKLSELPLLPYINEEGQIPFEPSNGNIGVFAIYDEGMNLRYVGQSRYCDNSLRCHLGRMPSECYHFKIQAVERPSRTILDEIKKCWFEEAGHPLDNDGGDRQARWENAINVQKHVELSAAEKSSLEDMTNENTVKTLREICRRVQQDIEDVLQARGFKDQIQFNSKLKEQGLLDVTTVRIAAVKHIGEDTKLDATFVEAAPSSKRKPRGPPGMSASPM